MTLQDFFTEHKKIAISFSGGCDSAYLLYAAKSCGAEVSAIYVRTPFQPKFELSDARRFCTEYGIPITVVEHDILSDEVVAANPADRCYHCKRALFAQITWTAHALGFSEIADGTNASDDAGDRPGMRALAELKIYSPLRLCGLTKADIRAASRQLGLFTADKPAYACLATRVPTDIPITRDALKKIEAAETALRALGFSDFRVRYISDDTAKLEVKENQLSLVFLKKNEIIKSLSPYFKEIYLNLKTR